MSEQIDPTYIICGPVVDDVDSKWTIPEGIETVCSQCGMAIYLSPSGMSLSEKRDTLLLCMNCGFSQVKADEKPSWEITEEQIEEIRAHHPEVLDDLFRLLAKNLDKIRIKDED